jgi:hypothetical protein
MRFSIDEYAKHFKMSKEMVYSKLRANRLAYVVENNITYIVINSDQDISKNENIKSETDTPATPVQEIRKEIAAVKNKTTVGTIIRLYQRENLQLKQRVKSLEDKIDRLIDDKEKMLQAERERIERVYIAKDDQLKSILDLVNTKLQLTKHETVHDVGIEEDRNEKLTETIESENFIELSRYLKSIDINSQLRKKIRKRFERAYMNDVRVIKRSGLFYLDFSKYDYSNLLKRETENGN